MASYISPSRRGACTGCGCEMQVSPKSAAQPYCRGCRAEGKAPEAPSRARHGTDGKYSGGCRCDVCKEHKKLQARAYVARRAAEGRPISYKRPTVLRNCPICSKGFEARVDQVRTGKGIYCSGRCQRASNWNFDPSRTKASVPRKSAFRRRAERVARRAAEGTTGGNLIWVQGACIICSTQFLSRGAKSRYCSTACRAKNRNRTFGLTWLDRMALFADDDWKCQLCLEPVDYLANPLSDWYPSLDHIVPRSLGGGDEISNLRTVHRWCNSVRGDLSHYTDDWWGTATHGSTEAERERASAT